MNLLPAAIAALLAASFSAWMLSGSPVPMTLSVVVLLTAMAAQALFAGEGKGKHRIARRGASFLIAGLAFACELHLYSTGQALAVRADLPLVFHLALALLWWAAGDLIVRLPRSRETTPVRHGLTGIAAGLILLAAAATTERYDFGPWQLYPPAAVPVLAFASRLLLPTLSPIQNAGLVILPAAFAVTALLLGSSAAADALRPWLFSEKSDPQGRESHRLAAPGDGSGIVDGASRHLPREADVRFRGQVMVLVKAHDPELFRSWMESPLYVRTSTLARFESDEVLSPIRSGRWRYDIDDGREDHAILLQNRTNTPSLPYSLYLPRESAGHLPILADSETLFTEAVYEFADDWYQLSPPDEITKLRYTATAPLLAPLSDADLLRLLRRHRSPDSGIHLGLPPSPLAARVAGLTARFDPLDPLGGIRRFLREETRYSLRFKTPLDSSPLESFLFGEGQGHCEHYAAATVLMLRSLGIASRVAYGYAGGIADPGKRILAFRDSHFHAWAEIRSPRGDDWIVFDTTPKSPAVAARPPAAVTLPVIEEALYHDYSDYVAAPAESGFAFGEKIADLIALLSRHFFLTTGIGLALLAGLWRLLPGKARSRAGNRETSSAEPRNTTFLPEFLRELERVGERLGVPRKPGHTWREYLTRIAKVASPTDDLEAAVAYYYGVCYIGKKRDPAAEEHFLLRVRQWHDTPPPDPPFPHPF